MSRRKNCPAALCALAVVLMPLSVQAQEPAKGAAYPHRLNAEEIAAHFQGSWSADATTSRGSRVYLYNNSDGTLSIRQGMSGRSSPALAKRTIKTDKNVVCFDWGTSDWRSASGCYRLTETEPKAYSLQSGSYRIDYRR